MVVPQTEVVIRKDGRVLGVHVVRPGDYLIGTEPHVEIRIENAGEISGEHAKLVVNYQEIFVEDLGSRSGTFVSGLRIFESTRVWAGQSIQVGDALLELRRLKPGTAEFASLAPQSAQVQRLLPEDIRGRHKYDIGNVVAQGGMGAILEAREVPIRRRVAMKLMIDTGKPDHIARFVEEAQITGQLEHPNIVPVYELGVNEVDQPYYTMKFVRGLSLGRLLTQITRREADAIARYPLPALLTVLQKACDGIAFAHSKSVIHRDLKPENIMLGEYGEVLVMDWGLAKIIGRADQGRQADETMRSMILSVRQEQRTDERTAAGTVLGTPHFMSPEQARGEIEFLDTRADIYALGAMLYQVLTLQPPVEGEGVEEVLENVRSGRIIPPQERLAGASPPQLPGGTVPEDLAAVAMRALEFEPSRRYQSVKAFQQELLACQGRLTSTCAPPAKAPANRRKAWQSLALAALTGAGLAAVVLKFTAPPGDDVDPKAIQPNGALHARQQREAELRRALQQASLAEAEAATLLLAKQATWQEGLARLVRALEWDPENARTASKLYETLAAHALAHRDWPSHLLPHGEPVKCATFSPDGKSVLTGSVDWTARLWNASTGKAIGQPLHHEGAVSVSIFQRDGAKVVTAGGDGTARIWDAATGQQLGEPIHHGSWIHAAALNAAGTRLVTGGANRLAKLWNPVSGQEVTKPLRHDSVITSVAFSPDGARVLTGGADFAARLWLAETGEPAREPLWHGDQVLEAEFSPDGRHFVTTSADGSARLWEVETGKPVGEPMQHAGPVFAAYFSADGKKLVTASGDGTIRSWSGQTGQAVGSVLRVDGGLSAAALRSDGAQIATTTRSDIVEVWDLASGRQVGETLRHDGAVFAMAFSADGTQLVTAGEGGGRIWAAPGQGATPPGTLPASLSTAAGVTVSPAVRAFALAVAGLEYGPDGSMRPIPAERRLAVLAEGLPKDEGWTALARWVAGR